jgi:deoxyadenosine/deoxycytidine kinase
LLNRFQQQKEIAQLDLFNQITLCDYLFDKDRIFASINLDDHEIALYEQVFHLLNGQIPPPDLVIFLQAKPEIILQRIKSRNVSYEKGIDLDYLKTLIELDPFPAEALVGYRQRQYRDGLDAGT